MIGRAGELARSVRSCGPAPWWRSSGRVRSGRPRCRRDRPNWPAPASIFDLEDPRDLARLEDPTTTLAPLRGLVVIDEIERRPDCSRSCASSRTAPGGRRASSFWGARRPRFSGNPPSRSPDGSRTSNSGIRPLRRRQALAAALAAGRISPVVPGRDRRGEHALAAGPDPDLCGAGSPAARHHDRRPTIHRVWMMLAHYHAQVWNGAELARAFGIAESTVKRYLDVLVSSFMVRVLPPWSENIGKRVVKTPKVYVADPGLLHALLDIPGARALEAHPKVGASFEGFALDQVARALRAGPEQCYFWATHQGAELDLLVVQGKAPGIRVQADRCAASRSRCASRFRISASSPSTSSSRGRLVSALGRDPGARGLEGHDGAGSAPVTLPALSGGRVGREPLERTGRRLPGVPQLVDADHRLLLAAHGIRLRCGVRPARCRP